VEGRARSAAPLIVLDASSIVGAVRRPNGIPRKAFDRAREAGRIALSRAVFDEVCEVLARPKFARTVTPDDRDEIVRLLTAAA
jgi:predicted nucleic acid-binding protein